jgi:hypothetical protein
MWEQVKVDLVFPNARELFWLYVQGLLPSYSFKFNMSGFLAETCDLQKSLLVGAMWAFGYSGRGYEALLWGSSGWETEVTIHIVGIYGQGDGSGLKGSYLHPHETFASLWSGFYNMKKNSLFPFSIFWNHNHEWTPLSLIKTLGTIGFNHKLNMVI